MQSKYSPQLNLNKHGYNKVSMFVCCCDSVAEEADGAEGGGRTFGYRDVLLPSVAFVSDLLSVAPWQWLSDFQLFFCNPNLVLVVIVVHSEIQ